MDFRNSFLRSGITDKLNSISYVNKLYEISKTEVSTGWNGDKLFDSDCVFSFDTVIMGVKIKITSLYQYDINRMEYVKEPIFVKFHPIMEEL